MKFEIAKEIVDSIAASELKLSAFADAVEKIEDEDEKKRYRHAFGEIIGLIYLEILRPIELEHPSLEI